MNSIPNPTNDKEPRDETYWAHTSTLKITKVPTGALNLNVEGRRLLSPLQGFGQLWQKTFSIHLKGASVKPAEVIHMWKENFPDFWPKWEHYYLPRVGIQPGEVGLINFVIPGNTPVGLPLSTGVLVIYADEESFTFMNPQGHMFAGWITFSAHEDDERTVIQVQVLVRANDPIYELGFRLGASKYEDRFWQHTVRSVAASFGVEEVQVETQAVCVDRRLQWSQAKNVWHNSGIRTTLYLLATPVRVPLRWMRRRNHRASVSQ